MMDTEWKAWAAGEASSLLGSSSSQVQRVVEEIVSRSDRTSDFHARLDLIENIRSALNPLSGDGEFAHPDRKRLALQYTHGHPAEDVSKLLWPYPMVMVGIANEGQSWHDWPTDVETANQLALDYASNHWDISPTLEQVLIASLAYAETRNYIFHLRDRRAGISALFVRQPWKRILLATARDSVRPALRAIFAGLVASMVFADGGKLGASVAVFVGLFVALSAIHFLRQSPARALEARWDELATDMVTVANQARQQIVPAAMLEQLRRTAAAGAVWPVGLWALLVRANDRCPWSLRS